MMGTVRCNSGRPLFCARTVGVTLIELLVVVLILSTVLGVVGASLMSGIRVWDTARSFHDRQSPLAIGWDTLSRDVMNAAPCYAIPWRGASTEMTLPAVLPGQSAGAGALSHSRLGQTHYYLDAERHRLMRKLWVFPGEEPVAGEELIPDVRDVTFEYRAASGGLPGKWLSVWTSTSNYPGAVRMTLHVTRGADEAVTYQRVVVRWVEQK